jgi:hypothetical protein
MLFEPYAHSPVTKAGEDGIIVAAVPQNFLDSAVLVKWTGVRR